MRMVGAFVLLLWPFALLSQSSVTLGEMTWTCAHEGDHLVMTLRAPTTGWVGIGFNQSNDIVGSDLLLLHVEGGEAKAQDMYVKGIGNPKPDTSLGGSTDVEIIAYEETAEYTSISFRRPYPTSDPYDYVLAPDQEFWLILAYSTADDFSHHSRMREHQKVVFKLE